MMANSDDVLVGEMLSHTRSEPDPAFARQLLEQLAQELPRQRPVRAWRRDDGQPTGG